MIKITAKANFSFKKLAESIPTALSQAMDHYADENMKRIKRGLEVGEDIHKRKFAPLTSETRLIKR